MNSDLETAPAKPGRGARGSGLATQAYLEIRQAIINLTFQPGQQLQESFLASRLGMSRTPIREALHRLEGDGLIEGVSSGGAVVAEISVEMVENAYYVIEVNEGLASRLASERMTDAGADQLGACIGRLEEATRQGNFEIWPAVDAEFHETIRMIASNPKLNQVAHVIYPVIERVRNMYLHDGHETERLIEAMTAHRALGEAILRCEGALAERLARELFAEAREENVRLLRRWVIPLRRTF